MRVSTMALGALLLLLGTGCGGSGTRPEDMSAKAHETEARESDSSANLHEAMAASGGQQGGSARHYGMSASARRHADAHRVAAATLRSNETVECQGLDNEVRAYCPLVMLPVTLVERTPDGVRVTYAGANAEMLLHEVKCHVANGATIGRKDMDGCPLYQNGLSITTAIVPGGAVLILSTKDKDARKVIQDAYVAQN